MRGGRRGFITAVAVTTGIVVAACERAAPPVVTIVAREYAFDAPDSIDAGPVTLRLVSHGSEQHFVAVARIDSGHSRDEYQRSLGARDAPSWVTMVGGVGTIEAGGSAATTLELAPGLYAMTCDMEDAHGTIHMMEGMLRFLVVRDRANGAQMPRADASITMSDYVFVAPDTLRAGAHVIEVKNTSPRSHMALLWRLAPGRSAADVVRWLRTPSDHSAPPITLAGGTPDLYRGHIAQFVVTLVPGRYVLFCLVDDVPGRTPHYAAGMVKEFVVN